MPKVVRARSRRSKASFSMLVLTILALSASGCAGLGGNHLASQKIQWSKPGLDQLQLNTDLYQCSSENTLDLRSGMSDLEETMAKRCMCAKGYTYT
jgi:hypothetical protein